jgi:predicted RNA methylase
MDRTSDCTRLNFLIRWFWIGVQQDRKQASVLFDEDFLSLLLETGILEPAHNDLKPSAMLLPFGGFLVAADHPSAFEKQQSDLVLWPNPTSKFLSRFTVRRHSRKTLDLGTGSGILSLEAAKFSDAVVATDLNERAVNFARFNACLNGITNIEVLAGDGFAPVADQKFDLILSNPPFFITPQSDYLFCENPMDLDGLCRRLVKESPKHLNEDGYMEMLCEWAQIKGQPWEERVAEWLHGTGCDAWVMKGLTQNPEEYAQSRIKETSPDTSQDGAHYAKYMNYYRHRNVEAIHDGLIVMRRREGRNFVRIEEVPPTPTGNLSELILSTFAAHDILRQFENDEKLLEVRPVLSPHARLEQTCVPSNDAWQTQSLELRLTNGFAFRVDVQPLVADFLAMCDGRRTARETIMQFAERADADRQTVTTECLKLIRNLVERGFMAAKTDSSLPGEVESLQVASPTR